MDLKKIIENKIFQILSSGLGVALIAYSFEIKSTNEFWWLALFGGLCFISPLSYFTIWPELEEIIHGPSK